MEHAMLSLCKTIGLAIGLPIGLPIGLERSAVVLTSSRVAVAIQNLGVKQHTVHSSEGIL